MSNPRELANDEGLPWEFYVGAVMALVSALMVFMGSRLMRGEYVDLMLTGAILYWIIFARSARRQTLGEARFWATGLQLSGAVALVVWLLFTVLIIPFAND